MGQIRSRGTPFEDRAVLDHSAHDLAAFAARASTTALLGFIGRLAGKHFLRTVPDVGGSYDAERSLPIFDRLGGSGYGCVRICRSGVFPGCTAFLSVKHG